MPKQLGLKLYSGSWGGRRPKSGRKRIHSKGVAHRSREKVNKRLPLHVNFKYRITIRNKIFLKILRRAILNARRKGLRIIHYSMQSNHVHFIIEAIDNETLSSGMRSLTVTMAKGIALGKVQLERYHLHVLKSLRETRNAIRHVLLNEFKHSKKREIRFDEYSSLHKIDAKTLAKKEKLTLIIGKIELFFILDTGQSYLYRMSERLWATEGP